MGQCALSERQKDLLRLVVEGLRVRPADAPQWWIRVLHDTGRPAWQGIHDEGLRQRLQAMIELADLVMFSKCGFIENSEVGRYFLVEWRLVDAVEHDFYEAAGGG